MSIDKTDAIFEVYTDHIVQHSASCDEALLWIISQPISERSVRSYIYCII